MKAKEYNLTAEEKKNVKTCLAKLYKEVIRASFIKKIKQTDQEGYLK